MNKFAPLALAATAATLALIPAVVFAAEATPQARVAVEAAGAPAVAVTAGKMLYGPNGRRVASIYAVRADGTAQVILNGRLVSVPVSSLSEVDGKVTTSLTKAELARAR